MCLRWPCKITSACQEAPVWRIPSRLFSSIAGLEAQGNTSSSTEYRTPVGSQKGPREHHGVRIPCDRWLSAGGVGRIPKFSRPSQSRNRRILKVDWLLFLASHKAGRRLSANGLAGTWRHKGRSRSGICWLLGAWARQHIYGLNEKENFTTYATLCRLGEGSGRHHDHLGDSTFVEPASWKQTR